MAPAVDGISRPGRAGDRRARAVPGADGRVRGCHTTPGPQGPDPAMYLAGGMTFVTNTHGTVVSRNLTPDKETGLGAGAPTRT